MNRIELVTRRTFLGGMFSAGAFVLGARLLPAEALASTDAGKAAWNPSVYLGIETDGSVIIVAHRSEMGTGIRSVLPSVLADELDADWARVKIEQAIGGKKYGDQNTDGSCSIRNFYDAMREAGASARTMLESAAAAQWGVPVSECKAQNHQVVHAVAGPRRQAERLRRSGGAQSSRRAEGRGTSRIQTSARIPGSGRSGGDRRQHLGRDEGPRETQTGLGSWREREL